MGEAKEEFNKVLPMFEDNPWAKEIMDGWPRTVLFELDSEESPFYIAVRDGKMSLGDGVPGEVDILVRGQSREFTRVLRRERDITHPIAEATIRIDKGKVSELVILDRILATSKRKRK